MTPFLQDTGDPQLVLGSDPGQDHPVAIQHRAQGIVICWQLRAGRDQRVRPGQPDQPGDRAGGGRVIAGDHGQPDPGPLAGGDRVAHVIAGRVLQSDQARRNLRRHPGTFRAHHVAICPEAMRIGAVSTAGHKACRVCPPWSGAPVHRTRPAGRLTPSHEPPHGRASQALARRHRPKCACRNPAPSCYRRPGRPDPPWPGLNVSHPPGVGGGGEGACPAPPQSWTSPAGHGSHLSALLRRRRLRVAHPAGRR